MRGLSASLLALALSGCAAAQINVPPDQSARLERSLLGTDRYLRVSCYATPFFGDATKKLLTAVAPEQVRLLENPNGTPVSPGAVEAVFPAGTPVRITRVEFPSAFVMQERVLYTPRTLAWIFLDVAGTPKNAPPAILVLRPGIKDEREFNVEVDRFLSTQDLKPRLESFSESAREGIRTKTAVVDMPAEALEMAWGYPERKKIELDGDKRKETWLWADGARTAKLVDGRVTELR